MERVTPLHPISMKPSTRAFAWRYYPQLLPALQKLNCDMQLKFLYVAITRARKNLWILDNSENAEPMKVFGLSTPFENC